MLFLFCPYRGPVHKLLLNRAEDHKMEKNRLLYNITKLKTNTWLATDHISYKKTKWFHSRLISRLVATAETVSDPNDQLLNQLWSISSNQPRLLLSGCKTLLDIDIDEKKKTKPWFFSLRELLYDTNINTAWTYYDLSFVNSALKWRCHSSNYFTYHKNCWYLNFENTKPESSHLPCQTLNLNLKEQRKVSHYTPWIYTALSADCYLYSRTIGISSIKD